MWVTPFNKMTSKNFSNVSLIVRAGELKETANTFAHIQMISAVAIYYTYTVYRPHGKVIERSFALSRADTVI